MAVLDGKKLAATLREEIKGRVAGLAARYGRPPALDVVLVGDDPASQIYVSGKHKACRQVGMTSREHRLAASTTQAELFALLAALNGDAGVDGILVQLPLPRHIDPDALLERLDPAKDVDGLHPMNLGRLLAGRGGVVPCTPLGCLELLESAGVELKGARAVVVGRSNLVGKPVALLLLERHATVTICHSRTAHLDRVVGEADVLVAAVGKPELIRGEWVKPGAVVIDVGVNRLAGGGIVGDVGYEAAAARASWITPVPGGVGPMTIACLLRNTLAQAEARLSGSRPS